MGRYDAESLDEKSQQRHSSAPLLRWTSIYFFQYSPCEHAGIAASDLGSQIASLRQKGIYTSVTAAEGDKVFLLRELQQYAKERVDAFKVVHNSWHNAILYHPNVYIQQLKEIFALVESAANHRR